MAQKVGALLGRGALLLGSLPAERATQPYTPQRVKSPRPPQALRYAK